jgi:hypothetical protein
MKINTSGAGNLLTNAMFYILEQKNREKEAARKSQEEAARQQSERQWQENNMLRENALADQRLERERAYNESRDSEIARGDLNMTAVLNNQKSRLADDNEDVLGRQRGAAMGQPGVYKSEPEYEVWKNKQDDAARIREIEAGKKPTTVPSPQTQGLAENIKRRLRAEFVKGNLEGYTASDGYIGALSIVAELSPDLATEIQNEYFTLAGQEPPAPPKPVKTGLFGRQPKMPVRSYPPAGGGTTIGTR